MPAYESGLFDPPAAVVRATVFGPRGGTYPDVPLLIDSGADVSVIPLAVAQAIGVPIRPTNRPVEFYDGTRDTYAEAEMAVDFLDYIFRGFFLVAPFAYGVLGRNILNNLVVTLDGPALSWSL